MITRLQFLNRFMQQGDLTQNVALQDKDVIIVPSGPIGNWNRYIKDIEPTLDIMLKPMSAYTQWLGMKALQKSVLGTTTTTTTLTVP